jgi:hypothetical protein
MLCLLFFFAWLYSVRDHKFVSWPLSCQSLPIHYVVCTLANTINTYGASGYSGVLLHVSGVWMWNCVCGMSVSVCSVTKLKLLKLHWIQITPLGRPTQCYCTTKSDPRLRFPPPPPPPPSLTSFPSEALQSGYDMTAVQEYMQINIAVTL